MLFLLLSLISCDSTDSVIPYQGQTFIKLFGGSGSEEGKDLLALPEGGFVLVGSSTSDSNGGKDVYVVRTDDLGNVIWENNYGGADDDVGNSVILGRNGSIYVCGEKTQDSSSGIGFRDVYVLNIDINNGSLISEPRTYGENIRDEYGTDIIELSSGNFFITSTWLDPDSSQYYLVEVTPNLDTIPAKSRYVGTKNVNNYGITSFESESNSEDPLICFGTVQRTVNEQVSYWFRSFIYNSEKNQLPSEFYGTENNDEFCTGVYRTTDGGFVISGYRNNIGTNNELIVKINPNRQEVWRRNYSNEFNRNIKECEIIQTLDGGYLVISTIELDDPKNDEISLLRLNSEGDEFWRKTYGSNDDDVGSSVIQLDDGSFIMIGTIGFEINTESRSKMCLMKLNTEGDLIPIN